MKGYPSTDHIISCDIPKELEILADPLVVKVWYNLVENAIRYGKKPVTIRFSSTMDETDLVIIVEDDGPGISMDEKKKIFEFGYGQNTGMGLPLSREILSITDITIEETGVENSGARFEIRVPEGMYRMKRKE
jgi:signal transduction histidine kinase